VVVPNEGEFYATFKRLRTNEQHERIFKVAEIQEQLKKEPPLDEKKKLFDEMNAIVNGALVSVEGLEDDKGEVTLERILEGDIYDDVKSHLLEAFNQATNRERGEQDPEKKS
jgi:hypothetical protein